MRSNVLLLLFALLVVSTLGMSQSRGAVQNLPLVSGTVSVHVEGVPRPREMMTVKEAENFTVPPGKVFVVTALAMTTLNPTSSNGLNLNVDGSVEIHVLVGGTRPQVFEIPPGFAVPSGSTIAVGGGELGPDTRAWGYLADE